MKAFQLILIFTAFLFLAIASGDSKENSNQGSSKTSSTQSANGSSNNQSKDKPCIGSQSCISNARRNFESTGKKILGEEYLGNGVFGISFLDPRRGEAYNSKVYTNCNCEVVDVVVSVMR